jgi:hypothetical protein
MIMVRKIAWEAFVPRTCAIGKRETDAGKRRRAPLGSPRYGLLLKD